MPERALLQSMFHAAVAAATPASCIPAFLPRPPKRRTFAVGGGRAAVAITQALEDVFDGAEDSAVAVVAPCSLRRTHEARLDPITCLGNDVAHTFFRMIGDQIVAGPTPTNVNDFRAVLALPEGARLS